MNNDDIMDKDSYITLIARRGDAYGSNGGTLDLLLWCNKLNLKLVTAEEARRFWEDPHAPYDTVSKEDGSGTDEQTP